MRGTERNSVVAHHVVCKFGNRTEIADGVFAHTFPLERQCLHGHIDERDIGFKFLHAGPDKAHRLSRGIAAVRERNIFENTEHGYKERFKMRGFAFDMLQSHRILLLRHDRRADRAGVIHFNIAIFRCRPDIKVVGKTRQGVRCDRESRKNIHAVVTGSGAVDRILHRLIKAEKLRGSFAINHEGR